MKEREPITLTIKRIQLEDVWFEDVGAMELSAIAKDIENRFDKISKEKNILSTLPLFAHVALYYAVKNYSRTNTSGLKDKNRDRAIDNAIERLSNCLNGLPMK